MVLLKCQPAAVWMKCKSQRIFCANLPKEEFFCLRYFLTFFSDRYLRTHFALQLLFILSVLNNTDSTDFKLQLMKSYQTWLGSHSFMTFTKKPEFRTPPSPYPQPFKISLTPFPWTSLTGIRFPPPPYCSCLC